MSLRYLLFTNAAKYLLELQDDDIIYVPLPLYHAAGGGIGVGPALTLGIPAVIRVKFSTSKYFEDCAKYNCTVIFKITYIIVIINKYRIYFISNAVGSDMWFIKN